MSAQRLPESCAEPENSTGMTLALARQTHKPPLRLAAEGLSGRCSAAGTEHAQVLEVQVPQHCLPQVSVNPAQLRVERGRHIIRNEAQRLFRRLCRADAPAAAARAHARRGVRHFPIAEQSVKVAL